MTDKLELRLYTVAVLAAVYVLAWRSMIGGAQPATTTAAATAPLESPAAVWLDEVPTSQRPLLKLPSGWRLASRDDTAVAAPAPVVVRAPASRPLRVRTRSS